MLYTSAILLIAIGIVHSILGEKYILIRLFHKGNLPKLFGSTEFTKNTLRFAWHLTTIAWFGFAALLIGLSDGVMNTEQIGLIIGVTFILHSLCSLVGSKGRHFSWPVFLLIGSLILYAINFS